MSEEKRNVYVGHRYVPKIMGEWDQQETYEGLTIVTHQGTSYTSKKRVPSGIDILNEEYWVVTGNYNAQVENYRQEVRDMQEVVNSKADQNYVNNEVMNIHNRIEKTKRIVEPSMTSNDIQLILNNSSDVKFLAGVYELDFQNYFNHPTCLSIPSNISIEMEKGVILKVKPNNYGDTYNTGYFLMRIYNKDNVTIKGGKLIGDRDEHLGTEGEWGYGIQVFNSRNVKLHDIVSINFWGDGFAVQDNSEDVEMVNCTSDNNRRQGLTIGHVRNFHIENCTFSNTNGTLPEAGVDIEPNGFGMIDGVHFENCRFIGNRSGIEINLSKLLDNNNNDEFINITGNNNYFERNNVGFNYTHSGVPTGYLHGLIQFSKSILKSNTTPIRYSNIRKDIMPKLKLNDVLIDGWSNYTWAINAQVTITSDNANENNIVRYGGLEINRLELRNFNTQRNAPSTALRFETNSPYRPMDLFISDLEGDSNEFIDYSFWNYGEGFIKFKDTPIANNRGTRGLRNKDFFNGLIITTDEERSVTLPTAYGNKGKELTFEYTNSTFIIRTEGDDLIKTEVLPLGEGSSLRLRENNKITLKSDGVNKWIAIEVFGSFSNGTARVNPLIYATDHHTRPDSSTFRAGSYIYNANPIIENGRVLMGWFRITTGSDHVDGVDWVEHWIDL